VLVNLAVSADWCNASSPFLNVINFEDVAQHFNDNRAMQQLSACSVQHATGVCGGLERDLSFKYHGSVALTQSEIDVFLKGGHAVKRKITSSFSPVVRRRRFDPIERPR
jgi:hypothetical protein